MRTFVVDASVAVKWFLTVGETLVPEAANFLLGYGNREIGLLVPDSFAVEVANVLWRAVRLQRIPRAEASDALTSLEKLRIPTYPSSALLPAALQIATTTNRTVYDSLYIALAEKAAIDMLTADERLVNAIGSRYPVKWLGSLL